MAMSCTSETHYIHFATISRLFTMQEATIFNVTGILLPKHAITLTSWFEDKRSAKMCLCNTHPDDAALQYEVCNVRTCFWAAQGDDAFEHCPLSLSLWWHKNACHSPDRFWYEAKSVKGSCDVATGDRLTFFFFFFSIATLTLLWFRSSFRSDYRRAGKNESKCFSSINTCR